MKKRTLIILAIILISLLVFLAFFYFLPSLKKEKINPEGNTPKNISHEAFVLPQQVNIEQEAKEEPKKPDPFQSVFTEVPFISQATGAQWKDPRFQDACEETSAFIAVSWAQGKTEISRQENNDLVTALAAFQLENWGEYRDTSLADTAGRIFKKYFQFENITVKPVQSIADILENLHEQKIIIVPINGQAVNNPYYTRPGPARHMVIIVGYDARTKEFITDDAGIGKGRAYRYGQEILFNAIRDYNTGYHEPFPTEPRKLMLVVSKKGIPPF